MSRDYSVFLEDIIEAIGHIREYTAGYSFEDFTKDRTTRDVVQNKITTLEGAAKKLLDSKLA